MIDAELPPDAEDEGGGPVEGGMAHWRTVSQAKLALANRVRLLLPVGVLAVLAGVNAGSARVVLGACAVGLAAAAWYPLGRSARSWRFRERGEDLLIEHGLLVRKQVVVPYGRMQFVDVVAGPAERALGICTLRLHTASAASDARIPGLEPEQAERLRDRLAALGEARMAGL